METITKASETEIRITTTTEEEEVVSYSHLLREKVRAEQLVSVAQKRLDAINAKIAEAKILLLIK